MIRLVFFLFIVSATASFSQKLSSGPQVVTFFSDVDDTEQPYGLYLPKNYDPGKKYPLVIMLHGAGSNHRLALRRVFGKSNANGETDVEATRYFPEWKDIDYIVASPFARGTAGYQGIPEKDVYDVLADVKKRFNIDEDRTYLTGLSMGGGGTLWIGLTRPDIWAALAPVCPAPPRGTDIYMPNALNVPMHFFHGDADRAVPVSISRDWVKKLKDLGAKVEYEEYPGVDHNSWENAYKDEKIFAWFDQFKRSRFPDQVKFSTAQLKYNKAYWVQFDEITPGTPASIDARFISPNQLQITTSNLKGFSLQLKGHPKYDNAQPLTITLDGKKVKNSSKDSISFSWRNEKWLNEKTSLSPLQKRPGHEGPVSQILSRRHIYVYGTGGNPSEQEQKARAEIATLAGNWSVYRNEFLGRIMFFPRIIADKDVRASDFETADMILFGNKETNSVIAKYADQLPMHLDANEKELGLVYFFNVGERNVVINSGLPWWTGSDAQSYSSPPIFQQAANFKDFILFRGSVKKVVTEGLFDNDWNIPATQRKLLSENRVTLKEQSSTTPKK